MDIRWTDYYKLGCFKNWEEFRDKDQLTINYDGDGGDTAQREGTTVIGLEARGEDKVKIESEFRRVLRLLTTKDNQLRRHPTQWNEPSDFSRDQEVALLGAASVLEMYDFIIDRFTAQLKRFGKFQNKDFASPEYWGNYYRALKLWPLYPFFLLPEIVVARGLITHNWSYWWVALFAPDVFNFIGSITHMVRARDPDFCDDINHCLSFRAFRYMPTPLRWLSRMMYSHFRPHSWGSYLPESYPIESDLWPEIEHEAKTLHSAKASPLTDRIDGLWRWYFKSRRYPPFDDLMRPVSRSLSRWIL